MPTTPTVIVIGAGVIGASVAWRLAQRGCRVTMITGPYLHIAASHAAAGMLAPITEMTFTDTDLLPLNLESLARYPAFVTELEQASGEEAGLRTESTLSVALTPDDAERLRDFAGFLADNGLDAEMMTSRQLKDAEPLLAPTIRSGLRVARDFSVDNRSLWNALASACRAERVFFHTGEVESLLTEGDRVTGVKLRGGQEMRADHTVLAAGAWSGQIPGPIDIPVRPVKGQTMRLHRGDLPGVTSTIRAFSNGFEIYVVPREHGEVVIGATVEEMGFDSRVTGDGAYQLLRDARSVVPVTAEYEWMDFAVGYRPGTPDNNPILGPSGVDGLTLACGHYRNGILLTPVTGDVIASVILDETLPDFAEPYAMSRFEGKENA